MFKKLATCILASAAFLSAAELPTAEAVFNKAINATGGKAAYQKLKTMTSTGNVEILGQGIKGTITIAVAAPDKSDAIVDLAGIGKIRTGTGNGVAWQTSAFQGPRVLDGEERDYMIRETQVDGLLRWHETYGEVKVDGEDTLEGKACWRLVAMPPKATKPETLWFEKESGLLAKTSRTMVSPMGEIPVEATYADYRDVQGLKMPYVLKQATGPQGILTTLDKVTINPDLPANQFELPADIQAILNKK